MTVLRRRLLRIVGEAPAPNRQHKQQKLRDRLVEERRALTRWHTRLKRAFNSVDRIMRSIHRLERKLASLEG